MYNWQSGGGPDCMYNWQSGGGPGGGGGNRNGSPRCLENISSPARLSESSESE